MLAYKLKPRGNDRYNNLWKCNNYQSPRKVLSDKTIPVWDDIFLQYANYETAIFRQKRLFSNFYKLTE